MIPKIETAMTDEEVFKAHLAEKDREIAMLRSRFNQELAKNQRRDAFVRWFATEYGLGTLGRKPWDCDG